MNWKGWLVYLLGCVPLAAFADFVSDGNAWIRWPSFFVACIIWVAILHSFLGLSDKTNEPTAH